MHIRPKNIHLAFIVLALLTIIQPAIAQSAQLKGIDAMKLDVTGIDESAQKCGIRADVVDAAVRIAVRSTSLRVHVPNTEKANVWSTIADLFVPTYSTSILAIAMTDGRCAVSVQADFERQVSWPTSNPKAPTAEGMAKVWTDATLMTGPASDMGKRVTDAAEGMAKAFLGAWLKSNP